MGSRKSKATRLIDALVQASETRAMRGNLAESQEHLDQIEEDYVFARFKLQYFIEQLQLKVKPSRG